MRASRKYNVMLKYPHELDVAPRGGARNFPTEGMTLPTRELKYGFQATINVDGGLACSDGSYNHLAIP